jgi:hypothetical protein
MANNLAKYVMLEMKEDQQEAFFKQCFDALAKKLDAVSVETLAKE